METVRGCVGRSESGSGRRRGVQAGGSRVDSGEEVWRGYTSRGEQTSHYMTLYMYRDTAHVHVYHHFTCSNGTIHSSD